MRRALAVAALAAATAATSLTAARAAVISVSLPQALSSVPVNVSLGGGAATFGLTLDSNSFASAADISTSGTGKVSYFSGGFFSGIADFGAGAPIDGTMLYGFSGLQTPTLIPNSQADDFVGLSYTVGTQTFYGFAEVSGGSLVGYAYETAANTTITTASTAVSTVPEPMSIALLAFGTVAVVTVTNRRRVMGLVG